LDNISPPELKTLLAKYPMLKSLLGNLQIELQTVCTRGKEGMLGNKADILYALSLGNRVMTDMPGCAPSPGAKDTNIIANYKKIVDAEYGNLIRELILEITNIGDVVEKITVGLKCLTEEQLTCVTEFYFRKRTWQQICDKLRMSKRNVKYLNEEGINELHPVVRISKEQYKYCMEQLKEKVA
jgi:hypothetical protein